MDSLVIIAGPTGGGKARIAEAAAEASGSVLLCCDSMKVYRGLDIGTAKPSPDRRQRFQWRGIDLVQPWDSFDTPAYLSQARAVIDEARQARRPILICGGTALYLKALTEGLFEGPGRDEHLRQSLRAEAEANGPQSLHKRLEACDPERARALHPNDLRRVIRALEVHALTGQTISSLQTQFGQPAPGIKRRVFIVRREREDMDRRIDRRVDRMIAEGWLEECRALLELERPLASGPMQAIGYREIFDHIRGAGQLEDAIRRIKTKTRRFARRQLTWLKHFQDAETFTLQEGEDGSPDIQARLEAALGASLTEMARED